MNFSYTGNVMHFTTGEVLPPLHASMELKRDSQLILWKGKLSGEKVNGQ